MLLLGGLSGMGLASVMAFVRKLLHRPPGTGEESSPQDECGHRDFKKIVSLVGAALGLVSLSLTLSRVFAKSKNPVSDIASLITETFLSCGKKHEPATLPLADAEKEKLWKSPTREDIDETPESLKG